MGTGGPLEALGVPNCSCSLGFDTDRGIFSSRHQQNDEWEGGSPEQIDWHAALRICSMYTCNDFSKQHDLSSLLFTTYLSKLFSCYSVFALSTSLVFAIAA